MTDLTREQIEAFLRGEPFTTAQREALCAMALRAIDAGWQPMSTAPRDGTRVLVWDQMGIAVVGHLWVGGTWRTDEGAMLDAAAWMPLPPPFTGGAKAVATEPGECAFCNGSGFANVLLTSYPPQRVRCLVCNGTGRANGGEHG